MKWHYTREKSKIQRKYGKIFSQEIIQGIYMGGLNARKKDMNSYINGYSRTGYIDY